MYMRGVNIDWGVICSCIMRAVIACLEINLLLAPVSVEVSGVVDGCINDIV
jgi:hypothetical protein